MPERSFYDEDSINDRWKRFQRRRRHPGRFKDDDRKRSIRNERDHSTDGPEHDRRPGDFLTLGGGGKKTVARCMIDDKIPRGEREQIPVLAEGNHVLWVVGGRISEYYKITDQTKTILQVTYNGGEEHGR